MLECSELSVLRMKRPGGELSTGPFRSVHEQRRACLEHLTLEMLVYGEQSLPAHFAARICLFMRKLL